MIHIRLARIAVLVAVGLTTSSCSSATTPKTMATPVATLPGYLACGDTAANLGTPSLPRDRVELKITTVSHPQDSITVGYEISSPITGQGLAFPIQPVPPTLVLIHDETIEGVQPTVPEALPSGAVNARNPVLQPLPYHGKLTITRLCPGLSWPEILRDHARYKVAMIMTRQNGPVSSASRRFLTEAIVAL